MKSCRIQDLAADAPPAAAYEALEEMQTADIEGFEEEDAMEEEAMEENMMEEYSGPQKLDNRLR